MVHNDTVCRSNHEKVHDAGGTPSFTAGVDRRQADTWGAADR